MSRAIGIKERVPVKENYGPDHPFRHTSDRLPQSIETLITNELSLQTRFYRMRAKKGAIT